MKILIADDHPLILAGLQSTIERESDIEITGAADSVRRLFQMIEECAPQLVLTDLVMSGSMDGKFINHIRLSWPEVKIVVLSAMNDGAAIDAALDAGASAYVIKGSVGLDVAPVLRKVAAEDCCRLVVGRPAVEEAPDDHRLTERERAVLSAAADGMTTAAIASHLWISSHTVTFHLANTYRKLGVSNRAAAVCHALQQGLI